MNKRIYTICTGIITTLGVVYAILEGLLHPFLELLDSGNIKLIISLAAIILVWFIIHHYSKKFSDIFAVLYLMARNNKLHPLRELVMVENDRMENNRNQFVVNDAAFFYEISSTSASANGPLYDVRYTLTFSLSKQKFPKFSKDYKIFSFYLIAEGRKLPRGKTLQILIDGIEQNIDASIHLATILGDSFDQLADFSGLYQVQIALPYVPRKSTVKIKFSYNIKNNIVGNENNYNFVL